MELRIQKLHPQATIPAYVHEGDAGLDLCASSAVSIAPGVREQVSTGLAVAIPEGYVGLIWDKSGVSHKGGIKTLGGVVDAGYRGEVLVGIYNTSDAPYVFNVGDKVAQMLIQPVVRPAVTVVQELDTTTRGKGGFGSTGT